MRNRERASGWRLEYSGLAFAALTLMACAEQDRTAASGAPHVAAVSKIAAGEYLTIVGGCNDCHTPGWGETGGNVPPDDRLTGASVGFRGPWGTSYPSNLRLTASLLSEDAWVEMMKTREGLPPMPWMNAHQTSEDDLRAMHAYLVSLGAKGEPAPAALAPGETPLTPVIEFVPVMPSAVQ